MKKRDLTKLTPAQRLALVLGVNKNQHVPSPTFEQRAKTACIAGKGVHLGRNL